MYYNSECAPWDHYLSNAFLVLFVLALLLPSPVYCQNIKGRVVSVDNVPLSGVRITAFPESTEVFTNILGIFVIGGVDVKRTRQSQESGIPLKGSLVRLQDGTFSFHSFYDGAICDVFSLGGKKLASISEGRTWHYRSYTGSNVCVIAKIRTTTSSTTIKGILSERSYSALHFQSSERAPSTIDQSGIAKAAKSNTSQKHLVIERMDVVSKTVPLSQNTTDIGDIQVDGKYLIFSPNGNDIFTTGQNIEIIWGATVRPSKEKCEINLSSNAGRDWIQLSMETPVSSRSYPFIDTLIWPISAGISSDSCLIEICPFLMANGCDESDKLFTIK